MERVWVEKMNLLMRIKLPKLIDASLSYFDDWLNKLWHKDTKYKNDMRIIYSFFFIFENSLFIFCNKGESAEDS